MSDLRESGLYKTKRLCDSCKAMGECMYDNAVRNSAESRRFSITELADIKSYLKTKPVYSDCPQIEEVDQRYPTTQEQITKGKPTI